MDTSNQRHGSGASLRERRRTAGLSQEALAHAANCSAAMVKLLEHGYTPAQSAVLDRIDAVLRKRTAAP